MSSLAEILGGNLDERRAAGDGVWLEDPPGFDRFVRDELGLPALYPRQREFVRQLLGDDPKGIFADPHAQAEAARSFSLGVGLWGKGSGKDYVCSVIVCYCARVLLCLSDPQAYLGLAPGEAVDLVNVAFSADQARRVFFAKLLARVDGWSWLRENFNIQAAGRRRNAWEPGRGLVIINDDSVEFPGRVRAWSRHAQHESYEGLNVLVWLMDEASAFLSPAKRENADAIYQTLRTSAVSRFGQRWVGMVISYPRHADDFTCSLLRTAQARPELGIYGDGPAKTWEVNLRTAGEPRVPVRDIEVPVSLAQDFELDFEEAMARYCCEPPKARDAFFRYPQHLHGAVVPGRAPAVEWEPIVTEREEGSGKVRRLRGVRLTRVAELPAGVRLYAHGDPGLTSDSFALALGYAAPATVMATVPAGEVLSAGQLVVRKLKADDPIEWERELVRTVIVGLIVWRPDRRQGLQVDLQNVEDTILQLRKHYPSIGHRTRARHGEAKPRPTLTFDHWNSALTIQRMQAKRLNVADEHWGRDFQVDVYRNARAMFANGLIELPDTEAITSQDPRSPGALYELERIEFVDGSKIDHPTPGGKDLADTIVRVAQHAAEHNQGPGMSFMRVARPTAYARGEVNADGERTPVGANGSLSVGEMLRAQQEQARRERPLGELVPADGTVDGRRMVFGTLGAGPEPRAPGAVGPREDLEGRLGP